MAVTTTGETALGGRLLAQQEADLNADEVDGRTMPHWLMRLRTSRRFLGIALALVLVVEFGLTGCSRSTPLSLPPDQIQTLHRDNVIYEWAYGDCPTSPPPAIRSAGTNQAVLGEETWPSGGMAGYECTIATRIYMAGVRFSVRGLDSGAITHAQLAFRLDGPDGPGEPPAQPPTCTIEMSVAEQDWAQADPRQTAADPYAVLSPGKGSALGVGSAHAVAYDSGTRTVTVDAMAAVGDWIAQRHPNQGFLFKSFGDCRVTRLSSVALILTQG